ncbi:MAG: hypothetical protein IKZ82_06295 [Clostridia bacterium]|nr:hypothetical protein [Clostridia bacterium]
MTNKDIDAQIKQLQAEIARLRKTKTKRTPDRAEKMFKDYIDGPIAAKQVIKDISRVVRSCCIPRVVKEVFVKRGGEYQHLNGLRFGTGTYEEREFVRTVGQFDSPEQQAIYDDVFGKILDAIEPHLLRTGGDVNAE